MSSHERIGTGGLLYIAYDGMLEPLGQSQVLAYLEKLALGRTIHLLSFEKQKDWQNMETFAAVQARMQAAGIRWHPRRYHKRPSAVATSWDIAAGMMMGLRLVLCHRIRIVHARSYVPAVMALALKRLTGAKFVFDMRGFWADERVDGRLWPRNGRMYRIAKWFERRFLLNADHIVSLTHAAVREMQEFDYLQGRMPPVTVIPTCADLDRFRPVLRIGDTSQRFTLGYVGSAGTWYLFDAAVAAFNALRVQRPDARFLVANRGSHGYICERLQEGGIPMDAVELCEATHTEVPALMARMDAGVFFYKPSYSRIACAPTKLGEFLGCGIPCLSNSGVGDMAEILRRDGVGVAIDAFDHDTIASGMHRLLALTVEPGIRERCVAVARRNFSLEEGVRRYTALYQNIEAT